MKPWLLPSGRQRGIPFIVPDDWSPEEAFAVIELLDDLRERIWQHYEVSLHQRAQEQRVSIPNDTVELRGDQPPF